MLTPREKTELSEIQSLSVYACKSVDSRGRDIPEEQCPLRTVFQRDRDRIIHCKAFRRLKHKTQVFLSPVDDHYRTRLTHTLEVAQISRTIARALSMNEDLTEAIALGHDLGHTPFGHAGERVLNEISEGGFRHYEQSVRVVERLEKEGRGLNLTYEVRNGILCHTRGREADTVEGRIVRIADRIAYINHDIDDAIRAGVITLESIPQKYLDVLGYRTSSRINTMILAVVENTEGEKLKMSPDVEQCYNGLHEWMYEYVYRNSYAKSEEKKVPNVIKALFDYYKENINELPEDLAAVAREENAERAAIDYIAGMTDNFAIETYRNLFIPKSWKR